MLRGSTLTHNAARHRATSVRVMAQQQQKVVVTGAGGRTGGKVLEKLLANPAAFEAYAIARSDKARSKAAASGIPADRVIQADIVGQNAVESLTEAFKGKDALVLATSCVPKIDFWSLPAVILGKITGSGARPRFYFEPNGMPEQVDWQGAKNQFDAAKKAGIKRVVVIGSMGGTDPKNFLNTLGDGNVLQWKRRAEQYLIGSGLNYTIIHPGGLIDEEGGKREILVDVDDNILKGQDKRIPRSDVAEFAIQALLIKEAENRSFDIASKAPAEGAKIPKTTSDFQGLLQRMAKNCDYSINSCSDWGV